MNFSAPINEIHLNNIESTNSYLVKHKKHLPEWTVVTTDNQTNGRGYTGNRWLSETKLNLTFSILIKPNCEINDIFYLNMLVANSIHEAFNNIIKTEIKWPNDIIINNKKIGGILIENSLNKTITTSIIGIGLNINQTSFRNLPKASSLKKETGINFNKKNIQLTIIKNIQKNYFLFSENKFITIENYFNKFLYKKNVISVFSIESQLKNGIIKQVCSDGQILIKLENEDLKKFKMKEIVLNY